MKTAKVKFKTHREMAFENDIQLAGQRLLILRQEMKLAEKKFNQSLATETIAEFREVVQYVLAILDVGYTDIKENETYQE